MIDSQDGFHLDVARVLNGADSSEDNVLRNIYKSDTQSEEILATY